VEGTRAFWDPEYDTRITVREAPMELQAGTSRRLKAWVFEGPDGDFICSLPVHHTAELHALSEIELEEAYLLALSQP
jgi:hypothetical protein